MNAILPAYIREGTAELHFKEDVKEEWFKQPTEGCPSALKAEATDMAFFHKRQNEDTKSGWTSFNEKHSETDSEVSTVGYMPIILAPAHDVDTLNTVVQRIIEVAESFNQKHVVLTVDQALFPILVELKWVVPEYKDTLIPRLGGLPAEVETEFNKGNWVVEGSSRRFNQVNPDQSQEWLNGTGKRGGGIVGITRTTTALSRWTLSYNLRAHIAALTRKMYHVDDDDQITYNESNSSRKLWDNADEKKVIELLREANVFNINQQTTVPERLQNMVTKDLATTRIEESLLKANSLGQEKLDTFVKERLMAPKEDENPKKLRDPLPKNKAPTFSSLYEAEKKESEKSAVIKANRSILQRITTAYDAGRRVDLPQILSHELMVVPLAIADTNSQLRTGNKSVIIELLSSGMERPRVTPGRRTVDFSSRWSSISYGSRKTFRVQHIRRFRG